MGNYYSSRGLNNWSQPSGVGGGFGGIWSVLSGLVWVVLFIVSGVVDYLAGPVLVIAPTVIIYFIYAEAVEKQKRDKSDCSLFWISCSMLVGLVVNTWKKTSFIIRSVLVIAIIYFSPLWLSVMGIEVL